MLLRRNIVYGAIILAFLLAAVFAKTLGWNFAHTIQVLLYVFIGLMVAGFIWYKYCKK